MLFENRLGQGSLQSGKCGWKMVSALSVPVFSLYTFGVCVTLQFIIIYVIDVLQWIYGAFTSCRVTLRYVIREKQKFIPYTC